MNSSLSDLGPPPLKLPQAPPYPCPFLTDEEIATYLMQLYLRAWTVQPSKPGGKIKPAPELVKTFSFAAPFVLRFFLIGVAKIIASENHHSHLLASAEQSSIVIRVHTHSGLRPASHPGERREDRVQPGITLRDVRFAYLVEDWFYAYSRNLPPGVLEEWLAKGVEVDTAPRPLSAEAIEARRHPASDAGA